MAGGLDIIIEDDIVKVVCAIATVWVVEQGKSRLRLC